jgi:hypothetical protein
LDAALAAYNTVWSAATEIDASNAEDVRRRAMQAALRAAAIASA